MRYVGLWKLFSTVNYTTSKNKYINIASRIINPELQEKLEKNLSKFLLKFIIL